MQTTDHITQADLDHMMADYGLEDEMEVPGIAIDGIEANRLPADEEAFIRMGTVEIDRLYARR